MQEKNIWCSIVGLPNMGKSTLLNRLIEFDLAITSPKAETTRNRIIGILTENGCQYVFIDTPGFLNPSTKLDAHLLKMINDSYEDCDCILFLTDASSRISEDEQRLLNKLFELKVPVILGVNKTDLYSANQVDEKTKTLTDLYSFVASVSFSALTGEGVQTLKSILQKLAVEGPHYFESDEITDLPEKQIVAEFIREKLLLNLRDELPHGCAVEIMRFREREDTAIVDIDANIYCERSSHKGMIIGKQGKMLKKIASESREKIEAFLGCKVFLQCWVKVRDDWRNKEFDLKDLGY